MSSIANIDYSSVAFPDTSGVSTTAPDAGDSYGDSTIAQIGGLFDSIGTAAGSLIPAIEGPQPLAPGQSYVLPGGKVVTTPPAPGTGLFSGLGAPGGSSSFIWIGIAILIVWLLFFRNK